MTTPQRPKASVRLVPEDLRRPAQYTARCVVRAHLPVVTTVIKRGITNDRHSLHDLRVALRRLRVWLDAYRFSLQDTVPKRVARKLHRIQTSTNVARDLEVRYLWLRERARRNPKRANKRQQRFVRRTRGRYRNALLEVSENVQYKFPRIRKRLARALAYYRVVVDEERCKDVSMALAMVHALTAAARTLQKRAMRVDSADDLLHVHRTRVAAKHLRYLLEPLFDSYQEAQRAIEHLITLQDTMGEFRDASILHTQLSGLSTSAMSHQARARLHIAREQYGILNVGATVDRILADVSEVVSILQAVSAEPLYHPFMSRAN